jgi:uncharacterized repeat protein (TIGR04052 family)
MIRRYVMLAAMASCLAACSEQSSRVEIPFSVVFGGSPIACGDTAAAKLTDLRFYVHNLRLIDDSGEGRKIALAENFWQKSGLAFIDLEDGSGSCLNGTAETRSFIEGTVSGQNLHGLEFTLGVPFSSNHGDPLKAQPPLGDADMHWHWRGGYKFLRAGIKSVDDGFWIHLGSTGCEGTIQNITTCSAPNRVTVRLDNFVPGDVVVINLDELVAGGVLDDAVPSDCSSSPAEESCASAFSAVGLDHATGNENNQQRLFSVQKLP